jgi:hypothetical protein
MGTHIRADRAASEVPGEEVVQVGGVFGQAAQRVGRGIHGEPITLRPPDDLAPAGAVRPFAVLQHNHRLGPTGAMPVSQ